MLRTSLAATAALCLIAGGMREGDARRHHHRQAVRLDPLFVPACSDERYCSIVPVARSFGVAVPRKPRKMHHASRKPRSRADRREPTPVALAPAGERTAVYDIAASTVTLPNGKRLEAHSGLGKHRDDPAAARLRMRGPTPPGTYNLALRERPFHGVRALRLNPTEGTNMHGRAGILAHSYMLGGNGQSNGCVSIRDYPAFLAAFLRGEVRRIIVVARSHLP